MRRRLLPLGVVALSVAGLTACLPSIPGCVAGFDVRIQSPKSGATLPGDGVDLRYKVTGANQGARVEVFLDGRALSPLNWPDQSQVRLTAALEPGEHTLRLVATGDGEAASDDVSFRVRSTARSSTRPASAAGRAATGAWAAETADTLRLDSAAPPDPSRL